MARLILGDETAAQLCRSFGMSGELGRSTGREHVVDYGVLGSLVRAMGKTTRLETSDAASLRRQTALSLVSTVLKSRSERDGVRDLQARLRRKPQHRSGGCVKRRHSTRTRGL